MTSPYRSPSHPEPDPPAPPSWEPEHGTLLRLCAFLVAVQVVNLIAYNSSEHLAPWARLWGWWPVAWGCSTGSALGFVICLSLWWWRAARDKHQQAPTSSNPHSSPP